MNNTQNITITKEDIGRLIMVAPIGIRGTQRIHDHGHVWKIKKVWSNKVLLEGTDTDKPKQHQGLRWVEHDDCDFRFVKFMEEK